MFINIKKTSSDMDGCQHACPLACPPACPPACPGPLLQRPRGAQYMRFLAPQSSLFASYAPSGSVVSFCCVSHTSGILYFWWHVSVCYICCAVRGQLWSTHRRAASLEAGPASTIFDDILFGRGMNGKEQSGERAHHISDSCCLD